MPRAELAEALWEDAPPPTWDRALTVLVSKLRALLAAAGIDGSTALTGAFGCYRLELPEGSWVDVHVAAKAAEEAEAALAAGDLSKAMERASLAASLARQPFLPGEEGEWVEEKRRELAEARERSLSILADEALGAGNPREAVRWSEEAIALAPFSETGYRRLMEAHTAAGNRAEALRVYERCRRLLADELGTYPSPETESIYRALLEAPPERAPSAPPAPPAAEDFASPAPPRRSRSIIGAAAVVAFAAATFVAVLVAPRSGDGSSTRVAANAVGFVDTRGRIRDEVAIEGAPTSVAFGYGALWVTNAFENTVSRIDPRTRSVRQTIAVGGTPSGITTGGGAVWVANHVDGTVSRIEPHTNTLVDVVRVGNSPTALAFGEGSLWVANSADRTLTRIDPAGRRALRTIRTDAVGRGVAVGAGSVWITDESARRVVRVDPQTNAVAETVSVGNGPTGIAFAEGALWVANSLDDTVSRIDAKTAAVTATVTVGGAPAAVAASPGAVWVSIAFGGRLALIDPGARSPAVVRNIVLGNRPKGLAAWGEGVWVALQGAASGHRGGRLVALGGLLGTIDPQLNAVAPTLALAYDGLTGFRRAGGSDGTQLVPNLATSIPDARGGGRSYTFRLRTGLRYSDGRPVRPRDFRRALERAFHLGAGLPDTSPSLRTVLGAAACRKGRRCDLSRGVLAAGESVTFRLRRPEPLFLFELSSLYPVPAGTPLRDVGSRPAPATGPYTIESFVSGRQLKLVRNPRFRVWSETARPDGYPDEILLALRPRPAAKKIAAVLQGRADVTIVLPSDRVERLRLRYSRRLHVEQERWVHFLFLDTTHSRSRTCACAAQSTTRSTDDGSSSSAAGPHCDRRPAR